MSNKIRRKPEMAKANPYNDIKKKKKNEIYCPLRIKKNLKYYILRLKKAEKLYSDYEHFSIGYV